MDSRSAAGCESTLLRCYCQLAGIVGTLRECGTVLQTPLKAFNYRIEKLTEYFVFPNVKHTLRDLLEMEAKVPSDVEWDVRVRGECDRQTIT